MKDWGQKKKLEISELLLRIEESGTYGRSVREMFLERKKDILTSFRGHNRLLKTNHDHKYGFIQVIHIEPK